MVDSGLRSLEFVLDLRLGIDRGIAIKLRLVAGDGRLAVGQLHHSLSLTLLRLEGIVGKGTDLLGNHLHLLRLHVARLRARVHLL